MSKLLIIILSQNDTEIKKSSSRECIIDSLKNGKLENKINNAIIMYRNAKKGNNIVSDADKIIQIKEYINLYDEAVVLYHSLFEDDLLRLKEQLGQDEKYKNIAIYSSETDEELFNNIVELLISLSENKDVNDIFDVIWSGSIKKIDENRAYSYRYETFLPFVFLHFGVQLQHRLQSKEKYATIFCNKIINDKIAQDSEKESDEVKKCCDSGINYLSKNGIELNNKFGGLVKSIYTDKIEVTPKIQNNIEEFIRLYGKVLRYAFLELTGNKKRIAWPRNINPLLTDVEKLFNIIDNGVASYRAVIEQVCSIRHELGDNAIPRLNLFQTRQLTEQLESLKMELKDLKIKFNKFTGQNIEKYFQIDFKEEIDETSKVIHEMHEEVSTGLDDTKILKMRDNLVCLLQIFIEKTLTIAPKDRK